MHREQKRKGWNIVLIQIEASKETAIASNVRTTDGGREENIVKKVAP